LQKGFGSKMRHFETRQLALIYGHYNNPNQPYLANWSKKLMASGLQINIFSHSPITARKLERVFDVSPLPGRLNILINFIKYLTKTPEPFYRLLVKDNYLSIKDKINIWSRYSTLLTIEPRVIHLVNSYIFPKYSFLINKLKSISVISFRGYDTVVRPFSDDAWGEILKEIFCQCNYLHYVSNYLREEGLKLGAPPEKAFVIYPGIDVNFYSPDKINKYNHNTKVLIIISVGRLVWQKGLINALKAVKILINNSYDIQYWIVGDGSDKDQLFFWRRMLDIEKNVKFFGFQTPTQIKSLLTSSDIFLQPSLTEAIPISGMEAGAMELPVIASNVGGLPELIEHGVTGLLVPPDNPTALAEAIMALANDNDKRLEMGKQARKKVVRDFSLEREAKDWVNFYQRVL
jgi:glycosyltransferase involved in cell wall biosynthesis